MTCRRQSSSKPILRKVRRPRRQRRYWKATTIISNRWCTSQVQQTNESSSASRPREDSRTLVVFAETAVVLFAITVFGVLEYAFGRARSQLNAKFYGGVQRGE